MDYDIKKGWYRNIEGDLLEKMMEEIFGNVKKEGDALVSSYGVLDRIEVRVVSKDKMDIVTVNRPGCEADDTGILDSKRRLNAFAERATGFDAKARMKRAQKKAKEGKLRLRCRFRRRRRNIPWRRSRKKFDVSGNAIDTFLGRRFEDFCMDYTMKHWVCTEIGKWRGVDAGKTVNEIDIAATVMKGGTKVSLFGECRFIRGKVQESILRDLEESSELTEDDRTHRYVLFAVYGFSGGVRHWPRSGTI